MILLLGSSGNKTLCFLAQKARDLGQALVQLDADDICQWITFKHVIASNGKVSSAWHMSVEKANGWNTFWVEPERVKCVINFLGGHLPSLFSDFDEQDRVFAKFETQAALLFALGQFPHVINAPQGGRLCGFSGSMLQQWLLVREMGLKVSIPYFYYGPRDAKALSRFHPEKTMISENIYQTQMWRPQPEGIKKALGEALSTNYLVYQRPDGVPIMATFALGRIWLNHKLPEDSDFLVRRVTSHVAQALDLNLSTHLFFYEEKSKTITFGSVTPSASVDHIPCEDQHAFAQCLLS